jgi:hypothetical protein
MFQGLERGGGAKERETVCVGRKKKGMKMEASLYEKKFIFNLFPSTRLVLV